MVGQGTGILLREIHAPMCRVWPRVRALLPIGQVDGVS